MGFLRSKTKKSDKEEHNVEEEEEEKEGDHVGDAQSIIKDEENTIPKLPSVQDRKAIMGCISCVLRLVFTHPDAITFITDEQNEEEEKHCEGKDNTCPLLTVPSKEDGNSSPPLDQAAVEKDGVRKVEEDVSALTKSKIAEESKSGTSFPKSKQTSKKGSSTSKRQSNKISSSVIIQNLQKQQTSRNLAFQKELLSKLASYLLLDEEYSTVYIELLNKDDDSNHYTMDREFYKNALGTYLGALSNAENGYKCLVLLLFRFLLLSSSDENTVDDSSMDNKEGKMGKGDCKVVSSSPDIQKTIVGYDARVRRVFKCLAVAIFTHFEQQKIQKEEQDDKNNDESAKSGSRVPRKENRSATSPDVEIENDSIDDVMIVACTKQDEKEAFSSRKFEALEDDVGRKLKIVSKLMEEKQRQLEEEKGGKKWKGRKTEKASNNEQITERKREKTNRQKVIRGLKIGTAGVVAGTLLAVTGGMAAPAIAAGIAAVAGGTVIATVATIALSSAAAVSTVFGVGGGALVAAKMDKRTRGLTEFQIKLEEKEEGKKDDDYGSGEEAILEKHAELSRTVCISGWLRDENDFRRPWGATFYEELRDKETLLRWYFSIKDPSTINESSALIDYYDGMEDELWSSLRGIYGKDPDMLLSSMVASRENAAVTDSEDEAVNDVIEALGFPRLAAKRLLKESASDEDYKQSTEGVKRENGSKSISNKKLATIDTAVKKSQTEEGDATVSESKPRKGPKDIRELWDFHSEYGGELYTVRWESQMIQGISNSVKDLAKDLAGTTTKEVLKHTTMATLMTAIALPAGILTVANMIDSSWAIAMERANEAGVELAHSLLESNAGHRPISLVGYSFGARVIYKCMRELVRHQEKWELQQERKTKVKKKLKKQSIDENTSLPDTILEEEDEGDYSTKDSKDSKQKSKEEEIAYIREPASIVEDVILMGCPVSVNPESWVSCQRVIGGRFINCFSREDMILTLMFRYKNIKSVFRSVGGIGPLNIPGVENYDVSSLIKNHSDYCFAAKDILVLTGYGQPRLVGMTEHYEEVVMEAGDEKSE